jgi:hypothetical protein
MWHFNCLIFQLAGNFWLLQTVDDHLFGKGSQVFTVLTATSWILYLLTPKDSPLHVKLCSVISIVLAYWIVPMFPMTDVHKFVFPAFGLIWALLILQRGLNVKGDAPLILVLLLAKLAVAISLPYSSWAGMLSDNVQIAGIGYILLIVSLSARKDAVKVVNAVGAILGQILSVLTGEPLFFLHSCAFTATIMQGLAHGLSGEMATLVKLMDEDNHDTKVSYEWAHVTFFPNLLFQAIFDVMAGKANKKSGKKI